MNKNTMQLRELAIEQLQPGQFQPRQQFDMVKLQELAQAIKATKGLLQPIVVRTIASHKYEIIAGERRWRAAMLAGLGQVSCLIKECNDNEALEAAIIENVSRLDLNPIEEAQAYQRLMQQFDYIHEEIAAAVGKSRTKITNTLRMLKLTPTVQQLLIEGSITEGHGKILASLPADQQIALAQRAAKQQWSVRKIEKEVKQLLNQVPAVTKDINVQALERALSDHIGCPVKIDYTLNHGKLAIHFHNLEVLEGFFAKLHFKFEY